MALDRAGLNGSRCRHRDLTPTVSVGLAILDPTHKDPESIKALIRAADHALYEAKAAGRNRVRVA